MPLTLDDKIKLAYITTAKFVVAMDPLTPDYAKYARIALQLAQGGQSVDWFVRNEMILAQGYTDDTPQATVDAQAATLLVSLLKLGFGA